MNHLEFKKIMEIFDINTIIASLRDKNGFDQDVYLWNDLYIHFSGDYYVIINGDIKLNFSKYIYNKYLNNSYGIRVDGKKTVTDPCDETIDGEIHTYHIDTKEGLVTFLLEYQDYLNKKKSLSSDNILKFDELMKQLNDSLTNHIDLSLSTNDWMKKNATYNETIQKENTTPFGVIFRSALDDFDRTINPFSNKDIELDNSLSYASKVEISTHPFRDSRKNRCPCELNIKDLSSGNRVSFYRDYQSFAYHLHYLIKDGEYLTASHYFSPSLNCEYIVIDYYGERLAQEFSIRYNITEGLIESEYGYSISISEEQKQEILFELLKAIKFAKTITIDNMKKQEKVIKK